MHPQTFLSTFWRMELRPHVFVAMSFAPQYQGRFEQVIVPAIGTLLVDGEHLQPRRVDISKSGDSILTEISDGIAHSRLVLADVSTMGRDSVSGRPIRNANVMYEVGLALACRHSSEVLLVRDDRDDFLFDVSTVPHVTIDFTNRPAAIKTLSEELLARLREQQFHRDARVQTAVASLSAEEVILLKQMREYAPNTVWGREVKGLANWYGLATGRLLDKGLIRLMGEFHGEDPEKPAFAFTPLGYIVHQAVNRGLQQFHSGAPKMNAQPAANTEQRGNEQPPAEGGSNDL
jgi:hypothetical protein